MNARGKVNIIIIILVIVLLLSVIANVALAVMLVRAKENSQQDVYDPEYTVGKENLVTDTPTQETEVSITEIVTGYITLALPEEAKDQIAVNITKDADRVEATFTAIGYEQKLILFQVVLAKQEFDGYILGVLNDETQGEVYVAVNVNEQNPEDWSDEQYKEICTLQEYVNEIMIQIQEDPRFVRNQPI